MTAERLRAVLHYDPETGVFRWLVDRRHARAGDIAGRVESQGYVRIFIDGRHFRGHRLAWLYMTGAWPAADETDHRNRVRNDNRWCNLREATSAQNRANTRAYSTSATRIKGVYPSGRPNKPWGAAIAKEGAKLNLGRFLTKDEAVAAYVEAAKRLHGEFAQVGV